MRGLGQRVGRVLGSVGGQCETAHAPCLRIDGVPPGVPCAWSHPHRPHVGRAVELGHVRTRRQQHPPKPSLAALRCAQAEWACNRQAPYFDMYEGYQSWCGNPATLQPLCAVARSVTRRVLWRAALAWRTSMARAPLATVARV